MHAVLEKIIGRKRERSQERTASNWKHYKEILLALNADQEVDLDELELVMEATGNDDESFNADIETLGGRLKDAADLERHRQARQDFVKAQNAHEAAKAKLEAAIAQLQPMVDAAFDQLKALELVIHQTQAAEGRLVATIMDPVLIAKKKELGEQLPVVSADVRESEARIQAIENDIGWHQVKVKEHSKGWAGHVSDPAESARYSKAQVDKHRAAIAELEQKKASAQQAIREQRAELKRIQDAMAEVYKECLVP